MLGTLGQHRQDRHRGCPGPDDGNVLVLRLLVTLSVPVLGVNHPAWEAVLTGETGLVRLLVTVIKIKWQEGE